MEHNISDFIQQNSPDGGFLQSEYWRRFQEGVGRKSFIISAREDGEMIFYANILTHTLPVVGNYFYLPRGPVIETKNEKRKVKNKDYFSELIQLAEQNNIGWIRIEPANEEALKLIKENLPEKYEIKKTAVDIQPKEVFLMNISKSEEEILAGMKQKTRYNIKLAEKKGVKVLVSREEKYIDEFCRLVRITAQRDKIKSHPEGYYRKMFEVIPSDILKLYLAEYEGKIIAANIILFFGKFATYMHGASDNEYRNVMAPYLLQWQAIQDAKKTGCDWYDFGGVKVKSESGKSWEGITKFKTGFAANKEPIQFPGSYDIILKPAKYKLYRALQKIKKVI